MILSICQAVLLNYSDTYDEMTGNVQSMGAFDTAVNIIGFFFGSFLITVATLPTYMIVVITPIYLLLLLTFWYLVLDFLKDIEIFGFSI